MLNSQQTRVNTPTNLPNVCKTAEEVIYSGKIHIIFRIINLNVKPCLNVGASDKFQKHALIS